jgi:hypothetical protein
MAFNNSLKSRCSKALVCQLFFDLVLKGICVSFCLLVTCWIVSSLFLARLYDVREHRSIQILTSFPELMS